MLNLKKGLALVLAAATAFTFAPVTNLLAPVQVNAAAVTAVSNVATDAGAKVTLYPGQKKTITVTETIDKTETGDEDTLTLDDLDSNYYTASVTTQSKKATATTLTAEITIEGVAVTSADQTFTVASKATPAQKATVTVSVENKTEVSAGKVQNSVYAVSGETYNLVDDDTVITYNGKPYTARELTWVLSKTANKLGEDASQIQTDKNINGGSLASNGVLTVTNAQNFKKAINTSADNNNTDYFLLAYTNVGGKNTIVYKDSTDAPFTVTEAVEKITNYNISASFSKDANVNDHKDSAFDNVQLTAANNYYLKGGDLTFAAGDFTITANNNLYELKTSDGTTAVASLKSSDNKLANTNTPLKGMQIVLSSAPNKVGTYVETATLKYTYAGLDYAAVFNITVTIGDGPKVRIADGNNIYDSTYDGDKKATDPTIYLDLKDNKTFDIVKHATSDTSNTTYKYESNSANVSVDDNGVITAKAVGTASVTVTPTADGVEGAPLYLSVRVNANGFDTLTVTGKDKDSATVLSSKDYENNKESKEWQLAIRQINYVQIEVTGNETSNITEKPDVISANKATLSYSFANDVTEGVKIDSKTGEITIPYAKVKKDDPAAFGVYAIKVVSAATATSAQTTSYYYVVVDYPDLTITGVQDEYTVGVCNDPLHATKEESPAINFYVESGHSVTGMKIVDKDSDRFVGRDTYDKDDSSKFISNDLTVEHATADGQIEHILVYNSANGTHGDTYKLVTIKSAPANDNYVAKIVNKDNGDVIYDATKDSKETAKKFTISDTTNIQVTLHTPVAVSGSAVALKINFADNDNGSVIDQPEYVTAVKNTNNIDIVLYPNRVGTQVIKITPDGHNSLTDRTDIHHNATLLAVDYRGAAAASKKPAKVTSLKIKNKKGAYVTVSWKNQGKNVLYRVYKKVGNKKTTYKDIDASKTTLSVKKGATVKVKIRAYVKNANGKKTWGPKMTSKKLKTDKK